MQSVVFTEARAYKDIGSVFKACEKGTGRLNPHRAVKIVVTVDQDTLILDDKSQPRVSGVHTVAKPVKGKLRPIIANLTWRQNRDRVVKEHLKVAECDDKTSYSNECLGAPEKHISVLDNWSAAGGGLLQQKLLD